jgi:hypothetical protein
MVEAGARRRKRPTKSLFPHTDPVFRWRLNGGYGLAREGVVILGNWSQMCDLGKLGVDFWAFLDSNRFDSVSFCLTDFTVWIINRNLEGAQLLGQLPKSS